MRLQTFVTFVLGVLLTSFPTFAGEIKTRYVTILYDHDDLLADFNDNLMMGRSLSRLVKKQGSFTLKDEVKNKLNMVTEKVQTLLDMYPNKVKFTLKLLPTSDEVKAIHNTQFQKKTAFIAFFNPLTETVYISVDDTSLRVLAHEIGHVIVESYFQISPPVKMHELLAQFVAARITD